VIPEWARDDHSKVGAARSKVIPVAVDLEDSTIIVRRIDIFCPNENFTNA